MPNDFRTIADFYRITKLSDMLDEDLIKVMVSGFTARISQPIVMFEFEDGNNLKSYEPDGIERYLHWDCLRARERSPTNCSEQEARELQDFIESGELTPICLCWNKGVHFRYGIRIVGIPVALALGGGYRVIRGIETLSTEDRKYIEHIHVLSEAEIRELAATGYRLVLEDRDGTRLTPESYRDDYERFISKVRLIERIGQDRFRSIRLDIEHRFFDTMTREVLGREYTLRGGDKELKDALRKILLDINDLVGYSNSCLMMASKYENRVQLYASTWDVHKEREVGVLQTDANWDKCFARQKTVYLEPGLNHTKFEERTQIDTERLLKDIKVLYPSVSVKRCCVFPFKAENSKWIFFFFYEESAPPLGVFYANRELMESICTRVSYLIERAHAEMDRMSYIDRLTHETINPMTAVRGHAEFVKDNFGDVTQKNTLFKKLDDIIGECDRAVADAEWVLVLLGKKEVELARDKVDFFKEIAQPVFHQIKYEAEVKRVFVEYADLARMPVLHINRTGLYRVMYNIMLNGVKYAFEETQVSWSFHATDAGITISAKNVGIGIPEGEEDDIFRAGVRGSNASQIDVRGSGQGLAICKRIVKEVLGGRVWFERGKTTSKGKEVIFKVFISKGHLKGG